jgi:hypothetical protein
MITSEVASRLQGRTATVVGNPVRNPVVGKILGTTLGKRGAALLIYTGPGTYPVSVPLADVRSVTHPNGRNLLA